jgi:hypothetical protein
MDLNPTAKATAAIAAAAISAIFTIKRVTQGEGKKSRERAFGLGENADRISDA